MLEGAPVNRSLRLFVSVIIVFTTAAGFAQVPDNTYSDLHWRMIGPFRGGRTRAATGVASQPNVFYVGQVNGGVWKSDDYGRTWNPIFDHESTQSIGAIAVAASDPNVIYVEVARGCTGPIYRLGTEFINPPTRARRGLTSAFAMGSRFRRWPSIRVIRTKCLRRCWVILMGRARSEGFIAQPTAGRIGRKLFQRMRIPAGRTCRSILRIRDVVYASMWEAREGPWEDGNEFNGSGGGLFKSTDGGATWHQLNNGLPKDLSQIYVAIAPSDSAAPLRNLVAGFRKSERVSLGRCGRELGADHERSATGGAHWRRRSGDSES